MRCHAFSILPTGTTTSPRVIWLTLPFLLAPGALPAQDTCASRAAAGAAPPPVADAAGNLRVCGYVSDSAGVPVFGAHLSVDGTSAATVSAEDGDFDLGVLPPGSYVLRARRIGYHEYVASVEVSESMPALLRLRLAAVPVELAGIQTIATRTAFERATGFGERRRRGAGVFFDRQDIEERRPQNLTDLLRTVSGFRVDTRLTPWGYQSTATLDRAAPSGIGCPVDFYVNGHEYTPTSMGIDNDVPAAQIEAVEIYKPSQIPPQFFGRRSRCGAVVIWTRYRAHEIDR